MYVCGQVARVNFGKVRQCKEVFQPQIYAGMDEATIRMENHPIFWNFPGL
jgi:hypothetical protein